MEEVATGRSTLSDRVHEAWVANADALWRSVRAWSADPDIASDAVAEAFAQALRRGEVIDDVGRWTGRAAFRIAAGMLQARRLAGSELTGDPPGGDWLPEDTVALLEALRRLTDEDRMVAVLAMVGGWPAKDIAAVIDSTPGAVRVRLHRTRKRLRTLLEDEDG